MGAPGPGSSCVASARRRSGWQGAVESSSPTKAAESRSSGVAPWAWPIPRTRCASHRSHGRAGGSSALFYAAAAHRSALAAAVRHAALARAVQLVSVELAATRTRQWAVEKRWVPRLEGELAAIRRPLDEQELARRGSAPALGRGLEPTDALTEAQAAMGSWTWHPERRARPDMARQPTRALLRVN
jgi:ATP synthase subunit D